MGKIRVLQVNKLYAPHIGGIERVVQDISETLADDINIKVLVCQEKGRASMEQYNDVNLFRAGSFGTFWSMPISFDFPQKLLKLAREADIIHFHLPFPLGDLSYLMHCWSKAVRDARIVVTWHSDIIRQKSMMKFYWPFLQRFLHKADVIAVTSPNLMTQSPYLASFQHKCRVIPLGVDISQLETKEQAKIAEYPLKYDKTVLFVGRLCYYKGVDYLIDAMKEIKANLVLIGQGELREALMKKCQSELLADKAHFMGRCNQEELNAWYDRCDVFVLPSVEASEAFGLVQIEAMSRGKPVINTNLPTGVPFVSLHEETGLTVPPKDAEALRKAISRILSNPSEAELFGQNGSRRAFDYFTKEKMADSYKQLYVELMTSGNESSALSGATST